MEKYKFLEDIAIADIAYEAYGKDLNELFENAALAIFEFSADIKTIEAIFAFFNIVAGNILILFSNE